MTIELEPFVFYYSYIFPFVCCLGCGCYVSYHIKVLINNRQELIKSMIFGKSYKRKNSIDIHDNDDYQYENEDITILLELGFDDNEDNDEISDICI